MGRRQLSVGKQRLGIHGEERGSQAHLPDHATDGERLSVRLHQQLHPFSNWKIIGPDAGIALGVYLHGAVSADQRLIPGLQRSGWIWHRATLCSVHEPGSAAAMERRYRLYIRGA